MQLQPQMTGTGEIQLVAAQQGVTQGTDGALDRRRHRTANILVLHLAHPSHRHQFVAIGQMPLQGLGQTGHPACLLGQHQRLVEVMLLQGVAHMQDGRADNLQQLETLP